jgi:hypothetical protein
MFLNVAIPVTYVPASLFVLIEKLTLNNSLQKQGNAIRAWVGSDNQLLQLFCEKIHPLARIYNWDLKSKWIVPSANSLTNLEVIYLTYQIIILVNSNSVFEENEGKILFSGFNHE